MSDDLTDAVVPTYTVVPYALFREYRAKRIRRTADPGRRDEERTIEAVASVEPKVLAPASPDA